MMPYGWNGGGWGILWMILSMGVMVALIWVVFRAFTSGDDRRAPSGDAKDVLAERFAKGEIDADEYHERLRVLSDPRTLTKSK